MNEQEQWAIVEVMGHQRYVGKISEHVFAGTGFVRVDVPENEDASAFTKLIGTGSIYCITPVSEEIARALAKRDKIVPVAAYELRTPAGRLIQSRFDDDEEEER